MEALSDQSFELKSKAIIIFIITDSNSSNTGKLILLGLWRYREKCSCLKSSYWDWMLYGCSWIKTQLEKKVGGTTQRLLFIIRGHMLAMSWWPPLNIFSDHTWLFCHGWLRNLLLYLRPPSPYRLDLHLRLTGTAQRLCISSLDFYVPIRRGNFSLMSHRHWVAGKVSLTGQSWQNSPIGFQVNLTNSFTTCQMKLLLFR